MNTAVIFDAFGTLLKIDGGTHPFREILKLGIEQGRRPQLNDAENLLSIPMDLQEAADFFGIHVESNKMAQLQSGLHIELAGIQAYPDGLAAVERLQNAGMKVVVCSNLAKPYAAAIERLYPRLDGYIYSFAIGVIKPSFEIYQQAMQAVSVFPEQTWMIGDSKRCDYDGPRALGIRGCWLKRDGGGTHKSLYQFADDFLLSR